MVCRPVGIGRYHIKEQISRMDSGMARNWCVMATLSFGVDFFKREYAKGQERKKIKIKSLRDQVEEKKQHLNPATDAVIWGFFLMSWDEMPEMDQDLVVCAGGEDRKEVEGQVRVG